MQTLKTKFNRLSLDQKLVTLIILQVSGFLAVAWVAISQIDKVGREVERIAEVTFPLYAHIENVRSEILQQRLNVRDFLDGGTAVYESGREAIAVKNIRSVYRERNIGIRNSIETAETFIRKSVLQQHEYENALSRNSQELLQHLFDLRRSVQIYAGLIDHILLRVESDSSVNYQDALLGLHQSEVSIGKQIDQITLVLGSIKSESVKHAVHVKRIAIGFIVLTLILAVVFFIAMLLLIIRRNISKPLQLLTDTINAFTAMLKVEESEFEKGLMERRDELGRMSRSFNRLKHDLWRQGQDLHSAKEEAERADRAKSMFLAAASHDLRQPLHAMQMYIAALRHQISDKKSISIVDDIDAVSISTARLLGALLDVSQLEAGAIEPNFEEFSVGDLLSRIYKEFTPVARQKNLDFTMIHSSVTVRSDPVLLERILSNFLSNAIRYTREGRILLGVRRRNGTAAIEVWDSGRGIPDDQRMAIFEDFHQIDNEERDRSKGLGLGLAIAKRLSDCMNHSIECDSILESGSRFAVIMELVSGAGNRVAEQEGVEESGRILTEVCVLLIEDDIEVMKATRQLLNSWGCLVFTGRNLPDVIKTLNSEHTPPLDFIIADNRLPGGVDGVDVVAHVHAKIGRAIPAVIITGDVQEDHIREITVQGYQVLFKPVQPAKLRALMSHLLHGKSSDDFRPRLVSTSGSAG